MFIEKTYIKFILFKKFLLNSLYPIESNVNPSLRFNFFDDDWKYNSIGKVGCVVTGNTPKNISDSDKSILWVTSGDIPDSHVYVKDTKRKLSLDEYDNARQIQKNSVLVSSIGIIGKACINKEDCSCNQQIHSITPYDGYDSKFIYYSICRYNNILEKYACQSVTLMLNKKDFSKIQLPFCSYDEQKMISDFLFVVDEKIYLLDKYLKLLYKFKYNLLNNILDI